MRMFVFPAAIKYIRLPPGAPGSQTNRPCSGVMINSAANLPSCQGRTVQSTEWEHIFVKLAQEKIRPGPGDAAAGRGRTSKASLRCPLRGLGLGFRRAHPGSGTGLLPGRRAGPPRSRAVWPSPYRAERLGLRLPEAHCWLTLTVSLLPDAAFIAHIFYPDLG